MALSFQSKRFAALFGRVRDYDRVALDFRRLFFLRHGACGSSFLGESCFASRTNVSSRVFGTDRTAHEFS